MTDERIKEIKRRARLDHVALKAGWPITPPYPKDEEYLCWFGYVTTLLAGVGFTVVFGLIVIYFTGG